MQSLAERANNGGHFEIVNNRQNWKYDWYTPTHSTPAAAAGSGNNDSDQFGDGNPVEKYPFNYKTWIKTDQCTWRKLLEANDSTDLLDVAKYSLEDKAHESVPGDQQVGNRPAHGDSLTVEDIRGAVGGVDGISGFSSSDAQKKEAEPQQGPPPADSNQVQSGNQDHNKEQNQSQDQAQDQPQQPQEQPQEQAENQGQVNVQDQDVDMDND